VEPVFFDKVILVINYFIIYTSIFVAAGEHVLKWVFLLIRESWDLKSNIERNEAATRKKEE
jgi:hypothetical protein